MKNNSSAGDVSIIIPSYNRPDDLETVLPVYFAQEGVKEIIIVDDGSSLSYQNIVDRYTNQEPVPLVYHRNSRNMGAGACRNIGLSLASGKYILWGEDDAFPSENYLAVLRNKIDVKRVVFGSIYYGIAPDMPDPERAVIISAQQNAGKPLFDYQNFEGYYRLKTASDTEVPWGHALILVEKEAYDHIAYFEGYQVNGYREETDAQVQMAEAGYTVVYTSDTCCYHFPARNSNGGQHGAKFLTTERYKIKNNNIFLDRHFPFLKEKYRLDMTLSEAKIRYVKNEACSLCMRAVNKVKRKISG